MAAPQIAEDLKLVLSGVIAPRSGIPHALFLVR